MKDRNLICIYYVRHGVCALGKECSVYKEMQHCSLYKPNKNTLPFRQNNKRKKLEKIKRKERWE